ncbi:IS66-like element accessory protein TnpA [Azospirillum isscasi]|uniref:IS66-like element accessory protein TnpA n=1 Tax=Azospirillum isscasi TaxID=3053926 RepID=UPI003898F24B
MAIPMAVPMAIQRVEVITGVERRRQFSDEEKLRLVEEAFRPGAKATGVARRLGVDVSLLYRWRRQFFGPQPRLPAFLPVTVATGEPPAETSAVPTPEPSVPPRRAVVLRPHRRRHRKHPVSAAVRLPSNSKAAVRAGGSAASRRCGPARRPATPAGRHR